MNRYTQNSIDLEIRRIRTVSENENPQTYSHWEYYSTQNHRTEQLDDENGGLVSRAALAHLFSEWFRGIS
eukprot:2541978-Amphidinium_carterae.1